MESKSADITPRFEKRQLDVPLPPVDPIHSNAKYSPFLLRDRMRLMEQYSTGSANTMTLNLPGNFNPHTNSCVNIGYNSESGVSRKHAIHLAKTLHPVLVPDAHKSLTSTSSVAFGSTIGMMRNIDHTSNVRESGIEMKQEKKNVEEYKISNSSLTKQLSDVQSNLSYSKKQSSVSTTPVASKGKARHQSSRTNPYSFQFKKDTHTASMSCIPTAVGESMSEEPTIDLQQSSIQQPHTQHVFKIDPHGNGPQSLVSLEKHEVLVSAAVTSRQAELLAVFKSRLQTTLSKTHSNEAAKIALVNGHLQQVCDRYRERQQTIYTWLGDVDKARDHIRSLKSEYQAKKQILTLQKDDFQNADAVEDDELQLNVEGVDAFTMEKLLSVISERIQHKKQSVGVLEHEIERIHQEIQLNQLRFSAENTTHKQNPSIQTARATIASLYASSQTEKEQDEQSRRALVQKSSILKQQIEQQRSSQRQERSHSVTAMRQLVNVEDVRVDGVESLDHSCQQTLGRIGGIVSEAIARIAAAAAHCDAVSTACNTYSLNRLLGKFQKCQSCLDQLVNPYGMWPCGHILCGKCVERGVERRPGSIADKNILKRIACLECRTEQQQVISSFDILEEQPDMDTGILRSMKIANISRQSKQDRLEREGHISERIQSRYDGDQIKDGSNQEDDQEEEELEELEEDDDANSSQNIPNNNTSTATREDYRRTLNVLHKVSSYRNPYIFPTEAFNGCHLPVALTSTSLLEQGWKAVGQALETVSVVHKEAKEKQLAVVATVNTQVHTVLDIGNEEVPTADSKDMSTTPSVTSLLVDEEARVSAIQETKVVLPTQKLTLNRVNVLSMKQDTAPAKVAVQPSEPVMSSFLKSYLTQETPRTTSEISELIAASIDLSLEGTVIPGFDAKDLVRGLTDQTSIPAFVNLQSAIPSQLKEVIDLSNDLAPDNKHVSLTQHIATPTHNKVHSFSASLAPLQPQSDIEHNQDSMLPWSPSPRSPSVQKQQTPKASNQPPARLAVETNFSSSHKLNIQTPRRANNIATSPSHSKQSNPLDCPTPLAQRLYREANLSAGDLSHGKLLLDEVDLKNAIDVVVYQDSGWEELPPQTDL